LIAQFRWLTSGRSRLDIPIYAFSLDGKGNGRTGLAGHTGGHLTLHRTLALTSTLRLLRLRCTCVAHCCRAVRRLLFPRRLYLMDILPLRISFVCILFSRGTPRTPPHQAPSTIANMHTSHAITYPHRRAPPMGGTALFNLRVWRLACGRCGQTVGLAPSTMVAGDDIRALWYATR